MLHRKDMTKPLPDIDDLVLAVATDYPLVADKPCLDINNIAQIADFITVWYEQKCGRI